MKLDGHISCESVEGMATKLHHNCDANMNSVGSNTSYVMNPYQVGGSPGCSVGSPAGNRKSSNVNRNGPGEPKKSTVPNTITYRDNTHCRERSPARESNPFRPTFEDFDEPPSPTGSNYHDDRIQNDLLDEICSDIGIKDATDLDIFDFDANTDQYIISQTHLPDDLECLDETITFGDIRPEQYSDFSMPGTVQKSKSITQYGEGKEPCLPINQRPVSDEVKTASQELAYSDCLASPTVSSTCPGSHSGKHIPRPASQGSGVGSPAIHSTSLSGQGSNNIVDDLKDIKELKEFKKNRKVLDSPLPSPALSCGSRGPPSVECLGKFGPPSVNNDRSDVSSTTPGPTEDSTSSCMLSSSPDRKPSYVKSSSHSSYPPCQVTASTSITASKVSQFCSQPANLQCSKPAMSVNSQPSSHDLGYSSSSSVGTGSHCSAQSSMDPLTKDKVYRFLDSQSSDIVKPVITCDQSSTSSSPPQHAAKRARIISSGNDLLEEMRNRYAFTKGADMYVPNKHPNIDGSYAPPPVPITGHPQQQQHPGNNYQRQFSSVPNVNFTDNSCMKSDQVKQFSSCSKADSISLTGPGAARAQDVNPYCAGVQPAPPQSTHPPSQQAQYGNQGALSYNASCSAPQSSQYPMNAPQQQGSMYGSCPNLSPQGSFQPNMQPVQQAGRPYSPVGRGPPVAQPRMSHGYNQAAAGSFYGQQYQTPTTSPVPGASSQPSMYPNRAIPYGQGVVNQPMAGNSGMNQSMSAPSTPMKQLPGQNPCYNQDQGQWNNGQNSNQYSAVQGQGHPNMYRNQQVPGQPPVQSQMPIQGHPVQGHYSGQPQAMQGSVMPGPGAVNVPLRPCSPAVGPYRNQPSSSPHPNMSSNCRMMTPSNVPQGEMPMQNVPQSVTHVVPKTIDTQTPVSQQGFMQSIIADRSSAFRSHPLFPLLRDLIIADMNFHTPSFPFQLIANLPTDFDRLLQNYLQRNPPASNYQGSEAVQGVIMDALKYAHSALIGKIQARKQKEGYDEPTKPLSAIEDFCERFDRAVKNSMVKSEYEGCPQESYMPDNPGSMGPPTQPGPPHPQPDEGMMGVPPHGMMAPLMPQHPSINGMHSQSYQDLTGMGPGPSPYPQNPLVHPHLSGYHERRANSLPSTPRKPVPGGRLHDTSSETTLNRTGSDKSISSGTGTGKSKVLPKESVALMMDWLRKHQDNPYPNDDEKEMLIQKTKLTINQINYWFTNARRRILPKWALQRYMEQQEKQKQIDQQQIGTQSAVH